MDGITGLSLGYVLSSLVDLIFVLFAIGAFGWFLYRKGTPTRTFK